MPKKIFISVGSRFAMDRLLLSVDSFLAKNTGFEAFAQVGNTALQTQHINSETWLCPEKFKESFLNCDIFISHAGMGNIILAAEFNKPIIIMPRQAELGEHINNHQLGTVEGLRERDFIYVVNDQEELEQSILDINNKADSNSSVHNSLNSSNRNELITFLGNYLNDC